MKRNTKRRPSEGDATSFSPEAQRALLGAYCDPMLIDPEIPTEWLYGDADREIHRAILAMKERGDEVHLVTLSNALDARGTLAEVGGLAYLTQLASARDTLVFSDAQIRTLTRDVKRHAEVRFEWRWRERLAGAPDLVVQLPALLAECERDRERLFGDKSEKAPSLLGVSMADVKVEEFHWLWNQRIALGKITMFDGDGGVGKSLVTLDLAARVAMNRPMPDGSPGLGARAGVVVICGEDGLADTVMPRLMAAGVSPEALLPVRAVNLVPEPLADGTISERLISLMADLPKLEATITAIGAKLLIVDPLTAYLGDGVDAYKDAEVRRVLTPLALMAERTEIAVVLVRHLNRSNGAPAQHRGLGSVAFLNLARLGLLFAPNPDAEGEYLVSRVKGNIGKPPPTMGYRITQIGEAENMPKVEWLGEKETSAEAGLAAVSGGDRSETRTATDDAEEWLKDRLSGGPQSAKSLIIEAIRDGIISDEHHDKPLRNARKRAKVEAYREGGIGGAGKWMWRLLSPESGHLSENGPDEKAANPESNGAHTKTPSHEDAGHLSSDPSTKMPSDNDTGRLSTNPEYDGANATSESPISPKMPSHEEPIGAGNLSAGHVSADTREAPKADVVEQPDRTCPNPNCGRHEFWDPRGEGLECVMCGEPLVRTDSPTPTPTGPAQAPQEEPQRRVWRRTTVQEGVPAYD